MPLCRDLAQGFYFCCVKGFEVKIPFYEFIDMLWIKY